MAGSTNASIHFVQLYPRMMSHLSRPAWTCYPLLLPKATSLISRSAQRLHLIWLRSVKETEPLDKTRAASGLQHSFPKAGISEWGDVSAAVREKVLVSWSEGLPFKVKAAEIRSELDSPFFLAMIIMRCCFSCQWKIFGLNEFFSLNIGEKLHLIRHAICTHTITRCEKTEKFFSGDAWPYKRRD